MFFSSCGVFQSFLTPDPEADFFCAFAQDDFALLNGEQIRQRTARNENSEHEQKPLSGVPAIV